MGRRQAEQSRECVNSGPLQPLVDVVPKNIFKALSDMAMLQIIFFAVFFGIVLVSVEEPGAGR